MFVPVYYAPFCSVCVFFDIPTIKIMIKTQKNN